MKNEKREMKMGLSLLCLDRHCRAIKLRQTEAAEVLVVASSLILEYTNRDLLAKFH